jgi:hypothetical protein
MHGAGRCFSPPPASRLTAHFVVEVLESRVVPAAYYWNPLPSNGLLASDANNWRDSGGNQMQVAPSSADDLYFVPVQMSGTGDGEGNPEPYCSPACVIKSSSASTSIPRVFNGVHLMPGYTGTVDFQVSTFVGVLELRSGNIAQNDAFYQSAGGGQLSVTQGMTWTGGNFNAGVDSMSGVDTPPPPGKLNLLGDTVSVFDLGANNTVALGSYVTLTNLNSAGTGAGAKLDILAGGSIILEGIAGMLAEGGSLCQAKAKPMAMELFVTPNNKRIHPEGDFRTIKLKGAAEIVVLRANPAVAGELTFEMGDVSLLVEDGAFQVSQKVTAKITCKLSNAADAPTVLITGGGVRIENGSNLDVTSGLKMTGGSVVTLARMDGPGKVSPTQGDSSIFGDITISGGSVLMNFNLSQGVSNTDEGVLHTTFAKLNIYGRLNWTGGTHIGYVNSALFDGDLIRVRGNNCACSISKDVRFEIGSSNNDSGLTEVPANSEFVIVDSEVAITGTPTLVGSVSKVATLLHSQNDKQVLLKKN